MIHVVGQSGKECRGHIGRFRGEGSRFEFTITGSILTAAWRCPPKIFFRGRIHSLHGALSGCMYARDLQIHIPTAPTRLCRLSLVNLNAGHYLLRSRLSLHHTRKVGRHAKDFTARANSFGRVTVVYIYIPDMATGGVEMHRHPASRQQRLCLKDVGQGFAAQRTGR